MTERPPLEWNNKPVEELDRDELIELVGALNDLVWTSVENFERLLASQMTVVNAVGHA